MAPSDHDLKSQLSDIQKRLSETTFNTPKRAATLRREFNDSPSKDPRQGNAAPTESKQSLPNFLTKKDKRVSLPVLDSSRSPGVKNAGKDMDFVVGLSENLLVECRRLQADNHAKNTKLKGLEEEFAKLRSSNTALLSKFNETLQNEEKYKDSTWELELKLQQISEEFKSLKETHGKTQKELNKQLDFSNDIRSELEQATLNKVNIEKELSTNKVSVTSEIQALKSHVDELNDENAQLNDEIEDLRHKLDSLKSKPKEQVLSAIPILRPQEDFDDDDEFNEPPISPVKTVGINNSALETETLKSSLSNAHQTIAKLRQQILKLRSNELSNKQPSTSNFSLKKNQSPVQKKSVRNLNDQTNRSFHIIGNTNRTSTVIESSDHEEDDWENFEGDTTTSYVVPSSPSRSRPISVAEDLIEDSGSDFDDYDQLPVAPLSSELHVISEEDVQQYAQEHDLVLLPAAEYENFKDLDTTFSEDAFIARGKEFGLIVLTEDDYDLQQQKLAHNLEEIKQLSTESQNVQHLLELQTTELKQKLEESQKLVAETQTAEKLYQEEAEELKKKLDKVIADTQTEDYIRDKATALDLHLVPKAEFVSLQEQLENPSHDLLHQKATAKNLKVISNDEHASLLDNILQSQRQLEDAEAAHESKSKEHNAAVITLGQTHDDNISSLKQEHDVALKSLVDDHESSVSALRTEHEAAISSLVSDHGVALDSLRQEHEETAKSLVVDHEDALDKLRQEHEAAVSTLNQSHDNYVSSLEQEHAASLASLAGDHEGSLSSLKQEHESVISTLNKEHDDSVNGLKEEHGVAIASLISGHEAAIDSLKHEHNDVVTTVTKKHEAAAKSLKEEHESILTSLNQEHSDKSEQLIAEIKELQNRVEVSEAELAKVIESSGEEIQELQNKYTVSQATVSELNENITSLKDELESVTAKASSYKNDLDNPSLDYLVSRSQEQNHKVISHVDHSELVRKVESPTVEEITAASSILGLVALKGTEHATLVERSKFTAEDLAKESGSVVIHQDEHNKLVNQVENPDVDYLTSKAASNDHVLLHKDDHFKLVERSKLSAHDLAREASSVVIHENEHAKLLHQIENPDVDYLASKAQSRDHIVISKDDHGQLLAKSNRTVEDLAEEKNLHLLTNESLEKLKSPSSDVIIKLAKSSGLAAVPVAAYEALLGKANAPSIEHISAKASELGLITVPSAEYSAIKDELTNLKTVLSAKGLPVDNVEKVEKALTDGQFNYENPSIEFLAEKAKLLGSVILSQDDYSDLSTKASKSLDELAEEENKVALTKDELSDLKNPSQDVVVGHASKHGLVTVSEEDHKELLRPSKEVLVAHATREGHKLVHNDDYDSLLNPSKEILEQHANAKGLTIVNTSEYDQLKSTVEAPSDDFLHQHATGKNLVLVKQDELEDLRSKAAKTIDDHAQEHGVVLVKTDEFDKLNKNASRTIDDHAEEHGVALVKHSEFDELKERAAKTIDQHAQEQGVAIVKVDELEELNKKASKSIDDHAKEHNVVLVPALEFAALKAPSLQDLTAHARAKDLVLVNQADFDDLSLSASKTIDDHAKEQGVVLVKQNDFDELNAKALKTIDDHAQESGVVLVKNSDYEDLTKKASKTLKDHAQEADVILVPSAEYDALKNPSIKDLASHAESKEAILVKKLDYDELHKNASKTIDQHAEENDSVLVKKAEFEDLTGKAAKTIDDHATENNAVFVPVAEYDSLKNPSLEKLHEHIGSFDHVAIPRSTYEQLESPTAEHLETKAQAIGFTVLQKEVYGKLLNTTEAPSRDFIEKHASTHGLITLDDESTDEFVSRHLDSKNMVKLGSEDYETLKIGGNLDIDALSKRLELLDLVAIEKKAYDELTSESYKDNIIKSALSKDNIVDYNKKFGLTAVPSEDFHLLKAKAEEPDKETIQQHAEVLGCVVIGKKEYESLQSSLSKVSKADLEAKALKIDHVLISKADFEQFSVPQEVPSTPSTPTTKFAATKDYFEHGARNLDRDTHKAKVFESAKSLGFVPVAADEYKHLIEHQKDHVITKSDLYKNAKDFNLTVLPSEEYKDLLKNRAVKDDFTADELSDFAKRLNLRLVPAAETKTRESPFNLDNKSVATLSTFNESDFTDALSRIPSNASTIDGRQASGITVDELRLQATNLGYTITPIERSPERSVEPPILEYDAETDHENDEESDKESDEEAESTTANETVIIRDNSVDNKENFTKKAQDFGLIVLESSEYSEFLSPPEEKIREHSKELGLVVLNNNELENVKKSAIESVLPRDIVNQDNIVEVAEGLHFKVLPQGEYDELVQPKSITKDEVIEKASGFGLVAVDTDHYESLKKDTTKSTPITWSKESLGAAAAALGLAVVSSGELVELRSTSKSVPDPISKDLLLEKAKEYNLVFVDHDEYSSLVSKAKTPIDDTLLNKALEEKGLISVPVGELETLKSRDITREEVVAKSSQFGFKTIPLSDYEKLISSKKEALLLSRSDVVEKALEFDLVAVTREELDDLRAKAAATREFRNDEIVEPEPIKLSQEEVENAARAFGLLAIPENSFIATNISRIPDVNNVVVLPVTYYNKLTKSETFSLDKVTNEDLKAQAKKRGFNVLVGDYDHLKEGAPPVARKSTLSSLSSSNSRRNLAEAAASAASQEFDTYSSHLSRTSSKLHSQPPSRSGSVAPISRGVSVDGGLSLMTDASLSEPKIIPALTQTVIGEYLFKYYRRLGPLSSMSESRHERYFWIHPYTMTLYWSSTSPVLSNPSTHRTKAAAIIAVESVDDNNPLPTGLYHKSIIVHSQSRSIRFTCVTRQRHNIWYNSLRYLIQRNMDGIDFDDTDFDLLQRA